MSKRLKRTRRIAGKAPRWLTQIAGAKTSPEARARHRTRQLGTLGPASEVRHIDPKTWKGAVP